MFFNKKKVELGLNLENGLVMDTGTKTENSDTDTEDVAQEMVLKLILMNQKTVEQPVVMKLKQLKKKPKLPKKKVMIWFFVLQLYIQRKIFKILNN